MFVSLLLSRVCYSFNCNQYFIGCAIMITFMSINIWQIFVALPGTAARKYLLLKRSWVNDWNRIMVYYQYDECLITRFLVSGMWDNCNIPQRWSGSCSCRSNTMLTEYRGVEWWGGTSCTVTDQMDLWCTLFTLDLWSYRWFRWLERKPQRLNNWNVMGIDGWKD